jgi:hypothetical protein
MQMKRNKDGTFAGEVTPTRFQFTSDKLVYPLKITQISVKDKTEALFYVQAPHKVDARRPDYQYPGCRCSSPPGLLWRHQGGGRFLDNLAAIPILPAPISSISSAASGRRLTTGYPDHGGLAS